MPVTRAPFGRGASQTDAVLGAILDEQRATRQLLQEILDEQEARGALQEQALDELRRIRQALERRARLRDADDVRVLLALVGSVGARRFSAADVVRHAQVAPDLAAALAAADCESPRALGSLFRRLEGRDFNGVTLQCVGEGRSGLLWGLRVCVTAADEAP
jgi:hypothetical protein